MSILPPALHTRLLEGLGRPIDRVTRIGGGSINQTVHLAVGDESYFLKWNHEAPPGFFAAEADGLRQLDDAGAVRVPEPLEYTESNADCPAFFLMEFINGPSDQVLFDRDKFYEALGTQLASLHLAPQPRFGLERDNFIGALPQANTPSTSWPDFYLEQRIGQQLAIAEARGVLKPRHLSIFERFVAAARDIIPDTSHRALLHGDLWSGNYVVDERGAPALVDPAVYWGDREVELAFTELFGGFPRRFYEAYAATFPLESGYKERVSLYQLYPLLVHANLFGGRYVKDAVSAASSYL